MNLYSLLFLNYISPFLFKLFLCLSPYVQSFVILFLYFSFCKPYKFIQSKLPLDYGSICSKVLKFLKFIVLLMHSKCLLYHNSSILITFWSSKHSLRESYLISQLLLVKKTIKEFLL